MFSSLIAVFASAATDILEGTDFDPKVLSSTARAGHEQGTKMMIAIMGRFFDGGSRNVKSKLNNKGGNHDSETCHDNRAVGCQPISCK